jgi:alanine-glyoxylate transaminase/serine-glyoxylate transaminase/serine-pyruvate transaminase
MPRLQKLFVTERGTPVLFAGTGTAGMEAALVNTLSPGDRVLVYVIGHFSLAYARMAEKMGLDVERVELPWGEGISGEDVEARLKADKGRRIKAVLAIHNETSTGVMTDIPAVRAALDRAKHPALLVVDSISGLGCLDLRFDEWGVDVAIAGSQKGLMLPPGLAVLCVSDKAMRAGETAKLPRCYFDWAAMIEQNRKGVFPYTPATSLLFGLDEGLDMLFEEGVDRVFARHARLAEGLRRAVRTWKLPLVAKRRELESDTVTAVAVPENFDADKVIDLAAARFHVSLGAGLGPLQGRAFRVGHLGALNAVEVLAVLGALEMVLSHLKFDIQLGSGVAAAQSWFLSQNGGDPV